MHPLERMQLNLDTEQTQVLREMLENTLTQLHVETGRSDNREFRALLYHREEVLQALLTKLKD